MTATTHESVTTEAALAVNGLWKIFGNKAAQIIGTPDAELSRKELQAKTGCVMAVKDVSFDVSPGEVRRLLLWLDAISPEHVLLGVQPLEL